MRFQLTAFVASMSLLCGGALAANYGFLKDAPISSFTDEEV
jgi:hypothetical protein